MIEKYTCFLCRRADKRSALHNSNESWYFVTLLFHLPFDVPHMQTTDKHNLLEPIKCR